MPIAEEIREKNIAGYLIYMWQTEDLIRAFHFNIKTIREHYISRFSNMSLYQKEEEEKWFLYLIKLMKEEKLVQKGHLQINQNIIFDLNELHNKLISCEKYVPYRTTYYKALPLIIELRKKNEDNSNEIETCFNFLYGIILLHMQGKRISSETEKGKESISSYINILAKMYQENKQSPLIFD